MPGEQSKLMQMTAEQTLQQQQQRRSALEESWSQGSLARCNQVASIEEQWMPMQELQTHHKIRTATGSLHPCKSCWSRSSSTWSKSRQSWNPCKCSRHPDRRDRLERFGGKMVQRSLKLLQRLQQARSTQPGRFVKQMYRTPRSQFGNQHRRTRCHCHTSHRVRSKIRPGRSGHSRSRTNRRMRPNDQRAVQSRRLREGPRAHALRACGRARDGAREVSQMRLLQKQQLW